MKKRKGQSLLEMTVVIVLFAIFMYGSYAPDPKSYVDDLQNQDKIERMVMIDQLLYQWAETHAGEFPETLAQLKNLGVEEEIINTYQYVTNADRTKYQVTFELANGKKISPKSNL